MGEIDIELASKVAGMYGASSRGLVTEGCRARGRWVATEINGQPAIPYLGIGKHRPTGHKAASPIRTCSDYPLDGNKVVLDIKTSCSAPACATA